MPEAVIGEALEASGGTLRIGDHPLGAGTPTLSDDTKVTANSPTAAVPMTPELSRGSLLREIQR